ncbi:sarcosine oxidase subunit gamma [Octadecabacter temperatus]|uniref:Sarcosine oxidase, gamma subunit family n=1 Tax=Octadecabacter temperatus TaxID=1458307 RepID=A0A0K0Y4B0_9RHOB|nr:sarcosine oxidase subunit gamma family protein [Octadecabacter temperatus]AKS45823.1 Sarcosine oxidase, gamma subunit family [Octadecabacter temperatus]SIO01334.1 sarcosine oxidase subunit gamma [Octadecabacter temperatus]
MSNIAVVTRADARGMITLRGDLGSAKIKKAVKAATGQKMPVSGQFLGDGTQGVAWMSPDELLLIVPYDSVGTSIEGLNKALVKTHFLTVDVSDARAVFTVSGDGARDVLARLCPVDLHPDSFGVGQARRTRLAQIAAAFWMHEGGLDVVCFRSVADYAHGVLTRAATTGDKTGFFA